ncbi:MAG: NAD(P)H-quinone oxidoreductase [Pseudomonadota bacterium]|nr:NAD(P)H-quinone oxidoreductase [Pseudomonadota bacterium]
MTIKILGEIPAAIPEKMRAISIGEDNSPASLTLTEHNTPRPDTYEILVKIGAAGVNRGDCYQRMGFYPPPSGASEIMGLEFAGTVVACGSDVTRWQPGARIAGLVAGGGYAEYGVVHEDHALEIPENMSFTDAAALPETIYTVWANVFELGGLVAGETLLIHGGSSGIGTTAIQMAKYYGATVVTTAGTDEKCDFCEKLGADLAINYKNTHFDAAIDTLTEGKGVNLILDIVGGSYFQRNISAAARGGRIVNIAHLEGARAEIDMLPVMLKNLILTGSTLRARPIPEKTRLTGIIKEKIWPLAGKEIKPIVDTVFPLGEAGAAQSLMETSQHIGKIILDCEV